MHALLASLALSNNTSMGPLDYLCGALPSAALTWAGSPCIRAAGSVEGDCVPSPFPGCPQRGRSQTAPLHRDSAPSSDNPGEWVPLTSLHFSALVVLWSPVIRATRLQDRAPPLRCSGAKPGGPAETSFSFRLIVRPLLPMLLPPSTFLVFHCRCYPSPETLSLWATVSPALHRSPCLFLPSFHSVWS